MASTLCHRPHRQAAAYKCCCTAAGVQTNTDKYWPNRPHRQAAAASGGIQTTQTTQTGCTAAAGGVQTTQTTIDHTDTASVAPAWI